MQNYNLEVLIPYYLHTYTYVYIYTHIDVSNNINKFNFKYLYFLKNILSSEYVIESFKMNTEQNEEMTCFLGKSHLAERSKENVYFTPITNGESVETGTQETEFL